VRVYLFIFFFVVYGSTNAKNEASKAVDSASTIVFDSCLNITNEIIENDPIEILDIEDSNTVQQSNTGITIYTSFYYYFFLLNIIQL